MIKTLDRKGVIVACDVDSKEKLSDLVKRTCKVVLQ